MQDHELKQRLHGVIERVGMGPDRERIAKYTVGILLTEVKKIIEEQVKLAKRRECRL